jgi:hypothetical protein
MWLSYLQSVGKVIWRYRRTIDLLFSKEIGCEETEESQWGGTAIVLRARESRAHGEGR